MDSLIQEFVKQVPALAVLAFIVVKFIRYLCDREKREDALHRDTIEVIKENSEVLGGVKTLLNRANGKRPE